MWSLHPLTGKQRAGAQPARSAHPHGAPSLGPDPPGRTATALPTEVGSWGLPLPTLGPRAEPATCSLTTKLAHHRIAHQWASAARHTVGPNIKSDYGPCSVLVIAISAWHFRFGPAPTPCRGEGSHLHTLGTRSPIATRPQTQAPCRQERCVGLSVHLPLPFPRAQPQNLGGKMM